MTSSSGLERSGALATAVAGPGAVVTSGISAFIVTKLDRVLDRAKGLEGLPWGWDGVCENSVQVRACRRICGGRFGYSEMLLLCCWLLSGITRKLLITNRCRNPEFLQSCLRRTAEGSRRIGLMYRSEVNLSENLGLPSSIPWHANLRAGGTKPHGVELGSPTFFDGCERTHR